MHERTKESPPIDPLSILTEIGRTDMDNPDDSALASTSSEEGGRGCRHKRKQLDPAFCPVCSVTLRSTEVDQHLACEIDKLHKLSSGKPKQNGKSSSVSPTNLNGSENGIDKSWETFQKIRSNRQTRQKIKTRKRKFEEVICPICNRETTEDITVHVENCLRRSEEENENIDVEGYEEYEWAGQSRVRVTSFLQGNLSNLGTSLSMSEEDEDLVVDGDDSQVYGLPQYSENDVILPGTDKERDALRRAVLGYNIGQTKIEMTKEKVYSSGNTSGDPVLEALKNKIRELESRDYGRDEVYKCLICMEKYRTPVISVCCWHVHCELCWLQTLGAKKLCPQCNMITSPSDLRRIYM